MQDAVAKWTQSQNAGLPFAVCFRLMRRAHVDTAEFPAVWFWPDSSHLRGQVARVAREPGADLEPHGALLVEILDHDHDADLLVGQRALVVAKGERGWRCCIPEINF